MKQISQLAAHRRVATPPTARALVIVLLVAGMLVPAPAAQAAQVGYREHSFLGAWDAGTGQSMTGEKPESKLWYHDGRWWGAMLSPAAGGAHTIHRLSGATWVDTGVVIDSNPKAREDVLSLGNTLYIVSRNSKKLARLTYAGGTYAMDPGFPVAVPGSGETLTLARDTANTLWLSWEEASKVYVARTQGGDDTAWTTPFVLPFTQATGLDTDDISAVIAFSDASGPAIGVMWSHQNDHRQYFAVHRDGAGGTAWTLEVALSGPNEGDDHINLKTAERRVFAVVKTSQNSVGAVLIRLLHRSPEGVWSNEPVALYGSTQSTRNTRPITMLEIDLLQRSIYVFMSRGSGNNARGIEYKRSSLDRIGFPDEATPFIIGGNDEAINNATSSKANATGTSGIVILASDDSHYWWNRVGGTSGPGPQPPAADFAGTPRSGAAPLGVAFSDTSTGGPTAWAWTFGDGGTSTARNPSHTYAAAGTYTVALTATNASGSDTKTKTGYISVTGGGGGGTLTFAPTGDAYVRSSSPGSNYGTSKDLRVRKTSSVEIRSYLQFAVTGLSGSAAAKLRVYVTDPSGDGGTAYSVPSGWGERTITWDNAPAMGTARGSAGATTAGAWVEIDVGTIAGDGTYSYALRNASGDLATYSSRKGANPPQLVVTPG
ncbi:MAG: DUF7594 domain-containing protein [Egibacteraceae bacterium]